MRAWRPAYAAIMESSKPQTLDIVAALREANEGDIRRRLDELDAEAAGLRTLLRAVCARQRARTAKSLAEGRRDG